MKKKTPRIVIIAVLSLITVLVWFGSEIFRNFSKKPDVKVSEEVLNPLDPTLNEEALNRLENSLFFDASQISELPSPTPIEEPIPSDELIPTESPIPTTEASPQPEESPSPSISPEP